MKLELDHVFILVKPNAEVADALVNIGMIEGSSNDHDGQGTSNRRFYFDNGMLEFLYVRDEKEANEGPAKNLNFPQRTRNTDASPFGAILHPVDETEKHDPFEGWKYQPKYFKAGWEFHIGSNSTNLVEPLCIYVPFYNPSLKPEHPGGGIFKIISEVKIFTPSMSKTLVATSSAKRLSIKKSDKHLMEISFNARNEGKSKDFRPAIPLIVHW